MNSQVRYLTKYVKMKLDQKLKDVKEKDLQKFFEEKGWFLYDMDKMAKDFDRWRTKLIHKLH